MFRFVDFLYCIILLGLFLLTGAEPIYSGILQNPFKKYRARKDFEATIGNLTIAAHAVILNGDPKYLMSCSAPYPVMWTLDTFDLIQVNRALGDVSEFHQGPYRVWYIFSRIHPKPGKVL